MPVSVENCRTLLHAAGFVELHERDPFNLQPGGYAYLTWLQHVSCRSFT